MTAPAQADDVRECMCVFGVLELPNRGDMVYIWILSDLFGRRTTSFALVVISPESLTARLPPASAVGERTTVPLMMILPDDVRRQPATVAVH
jgi:hypothetical protein